MLSGMDMSSLMLAATARYGRLALLGPTSPNKVALQSEISNFVLESCFGSASSFVQFRILFFFLKDKTKFNKKFNKPSKM
jgi:hypothetical protein